MTFFQAIAFGVVQGITEFLPISSSAHLLLLPWFMGWKDPGLAFDVALHWGTLIGVVTYYRRDLWELAKSPRNPLILKLAAATVPGAVLGLILEKHAENTLRSPWITATAMAVMGILLYSADRRSAAATHSSSEISWGQALLIGTSQGIALIPGVSRSGITISTALLLGLSRPSAVQFSFLLSIPITFGAGLLKSKYLLDNLGDPTVLAGIVSSAVAGFLAIGFLVKFVRTKSFTPFVVYRLILSGVIVWFLLR